MHAVVLVIFNLHMIAYQNFKIGHMTLTSSYPLASTIPNMKEAPKRKNMDSLW